MRGAAILLALCTAVPAAAQPAAMEAATAAATSALPEELTDSQSIGHSDDGSLMYPFALESTDTLISVKQHRYGTRELVGLLTRAADAVARIAPGSKLAVGDLSSEAGGPLAPHGSHQSGRDADVGFYVVDATDGRPIPRAIFGNIAPDGTGRRGTVRFDDARNWALLTAFVDDPMAEVQHVLLAAHLRQRLLDYARAIGAPEDQIRRVELVIEPIRGSENHDDHFHVRIYCSVGDRPQCLDKPPLHPWYYGTPSPRAVAAARVADLQRAAAMRRMQEQERLAAASLAHDRSREQMLEAARARELRLEPARQAAAERARASLLSRDERLAILEAQRREAELAREMRRSLFDERSRAQSLASDELRWRAQERRRATRLREQQRRFEAEERRRAAALRRSEQRVQAELRRAAARQEADARRARELLRRSEQLERQRARQR